MVLLVPWMGISSLVNWAHAVTTVLVLAGRFITQDTTYESRECMLWLAGMLAYIRMFCSAGAATVIAMSEHFLDVGPWTLLHVHMYSATAAMYILYMLSCYCSCCCICCSLLCLVGRPLSQVGCVFAYLCCLLALRSSL